MYKKQGVFKRAATAIRGLRAAIVIIMLFAPGDSAAVYFTAKTIGSFSNVTVVSVTGNYDAIDAAGDINTMPRKKTAKLFYNQNSDDYDFLVVFTNFDLIMPKAEAEAFYVSIKNDVQGIGIPLFDYSGLFGSAARLQGMIEMGNLSKWDTDPLEPGFGHLMEILSHELLHRWAVAVRFRTPDGGLSDALLGRDRAHWSFLLDTKGSLLYGNHWSDNGDGTYTSLAPRNHFCPLDLYLMGFAGKETVPPMLLIHNSDTDRMRLPEEGVTLTGTPRYVTIDAIIDAEGPRTPDCVKSPKHFTLGCLYLVRPGTFEGYEPGILRTLLKQWEIWYSSLTDGKSTIAFTATPFEDIVPNPGIEDPAKSPRTTPPALMDGVAWLMSQQAADGGWESDPRTASRDTAVAVIALNGFVSAQTNHELGLQWLDKQESLVTDYLARKTEAFVRAGWPADNLIQLLAVRGNQDGGWGSDRGYASNPLDTGLVLGLLSHADAGAGKVDETLAYLMEKQNQDGSWGPGRDGGDLQTTALVFKALSLYQTTHDLEQPLQKAVTWLLAEQTAGGGFGKPSPTVYETALAVLGLRTCPQAGKAIDAAVTWLFDNQSQNGSWYDSVYQSALAVQALYAINQGPELSVTTGGITLSPDRIPHFPCFMRMEALVANHGLTDAADVQVHLYDGAPDESHRIGQTFVSVPALSGVPAVFEFTITQEDYHRFYVLVDPDNRIVESIESNNTAIKTVATAPSHNFAIAPDDLHIAPGSVRVGEPVVISVRVHNAGTREALHVPVRFYLETAQGPVDIAAPTADIPANGHSQVTYTWSADRVGEDQILCVQADPFDAFEEFNEEDNLARGALSVLPHRLPNVSVSFKDLSFSAEPADQLGSVVIQVVVANDGGVDADNVAVRFGYRQSGQVETTIGALSLDSLAAGARRNVEITWPSIPVAGQWLVDVTLDPDNQIQEFNETDNHAFKPLTIRNLPEFVVGPGAITLSPTAPAEGDIVTVTVQIQNTGEQAGINVPVVLSEGQSVIAAQSLAFIEPAAAEAIDFTYDTTGKAGLHTLTIQVNPDGAVVEQSPGNNITSKSFGIQNSDLWVEHPYVSLDGNGGTSFFFRLENPADVTVVVVDAYGRVVRVFDEPAFEGTTGATVFWDARGENNMPVPDGLYLIQVRDRSGAVLSALSVTVDNNLSSLAEAMGGKFLALKNITCPLPETTQLKWLPDESGLIFHIGKKDNKALDYPPGLYGMTPDGGGIACLFADEVYDPNNPDGFRVSKACGGDYFFIAPEGDRLAYIVSHYNKLDSEQQVTMLKSELWITATRGGAHRLLDVFPNTATADPDNPNATMYHGLKWSADGQFIAYPVSVSGGNNKELRIKSVSGDMARVVPVHDQNDQYLWSPFQPALLFIDKAADYRWQVFVFDEINGVRKVYETSDYAAIDLMHWLDPHKILLYETYSDHLDKLVVIDVNNPGEEVPYAALNGMLFYTDRFESDTVKVKPGGGGFVVTVKKPASETDEGAYTTGWKPEDGYWKVMLCDENGGCDEIHQTPYIKGGPFWENSISQFVWSHQGDKLAFVDDVYEQIDSCNYHGHIIVYDLKTRAKKTLRVSKNNHICVPDNSGGPEGGGSFHIMTSAENAWIEKAVLHFGSNFEDQSVPIDQWIESSGQTLDLRIFHIGTDAAEIDAIFLQKNEQRYYPVSAEILDSGEDILPLIIDSDQKGAGVAGKTVAYRWIDLPADLKQMVMTLRALEYSHPGGPPDDNSGPPPPAIVTAGVQRLMKNSLRWLYDGVWLMAADVEGYYFLNSYTGERKEIDIQDTLLSALKTIGQGENWCFKVQGGRVYLSLDTYFQKNAYLPLPKLDFYFAQLGISDGWWCGDREKDKIYMHCYKTDTKIEIPYVYAIELSPRSRYLTFQRHHDVQSVCAELGRTDTWLGYSLQNLTADLRIAKKEDEIEIKGTATDANLDQWRLEYAFVHAPDLWRPIAPPSGRAVVNDELGLWIPPGPSAYYIRLSVSDKAGHLMQARKRVTWGLSSSVTDIYLEDRYMSPNGDGVKDALQLNYTVMEPVNLEIGIYDTHDSLVNTLIRRYPEIPPEALPTHLVWNGLDSDGKIVPDGQYWLEILGHRFNFVVDAAPPRARIAISPIDQFRYLLPDEYEIDILQRNDTRKYFYTGFLLDFLADDEHIDYWMIEKGLGETQTQWEIDVYRSERTGAGKLMHPNGKWKNLAGKKYRLTVEDLAGNKSSDITEKIDETIFIVYWFANNDFQDEDSEIQTARGDSGSMITTSSEKILPTGYIYGNSRCNLYVVSTVTELDHYAVQIYDKDTQQWEEIDRYPGDMPDILGLK